jgi:membrane protein YqaA with SNARE-associated domain
MDTVAVTVSGSIPGSLLGVALGLLGFRFRKRIGNRWWKETDVAFLRDFTPQRVESYVWMWGGFSLLFAGACLVAAVWLIVEAMT